MSLLALTAAIIYTRFPIADGSGLIAAEYTRQLNLRQHKYEFRLSVIPGSGGEGADLKALAEARAGSNVLVYGALSNFSVNRFLFGNSYDRDNDFKLLQNIATLPVSIMVKPDSPYRTVEELVAGLKAKPLAFEGMTTGSTSARLLDVVFRAHYNITNVKQLSYPNAQDITRNVLSGEADYTVTNPMDTPGLRQLAISSPTRDPRFPGVPTGNELGIKDFNWMASVALYAPKESKFVEELRPLFTAICLSEEMAEIYKKVRMNGTCTEDLNILNGEIQNQREVIDRHKEAIK